MSTRSAGRLPTHELTARRLRKRTITHLPALLPYHTPAPKPAPDTRTTVPGCLIAPYNQPKIKRNHLL
jgi:hypothetical protein